MTATCRLHGQASERPGITLRRSYNDEAYEGEPRGLSNGAYLACSDDQLP